MNVLAFFAHPDDEIMLSGGILILLARAGVRMHYLCATRGEGGEVGEPPLCEHDKLGQVREEELKCAVKVMGGESVDFLDYVDPRVGPNNNLYPYTNDLRGIAIQIKRKIEDLGVDAIITHGSNGEYGHPAHIITHQAAKLAASVYEGDSPHLFTVSAAFPEHPKPRIANRDDPAHLILDVTPVMSTKIEAVHCHRSQHALFVRRASKAAGRQLSVADVMVNLESIHRVSPPYTEDNDHLFNKLKPWEYNP